MLKRFNRKVMLDGVLREARSRSHHEKQPTRRKRKEAAQRRATIRAARKALIRKGPGRSSLK